MPRNKLFDLGKLQVRSKETSKCAWSSIESRDSSNEDNHLEWVLFEGSETGLLPTVNIGC